MVHVSAIDNRFAWKSRGEVEVKSRMSENRSQMPPEAVERRRQSNLFEYLLFLDTQNCYRR